MTKSYYLVTVKYLPMPALVEKVLTVQAHDEEQAKQKALKQACKEWDLFPDAMQLMEITCIVHSGRR